MTNEPMTPDDVQRLLDGTTTGPWERDEAVRLLRNALDMNDRASYVIERFFARLSVVPAEATRRSHDLA